MGKHKPISQPAIEIARWMVAEVAAHGYTVATRAELLERIAARPWVKPDYINEALRAMAVSWHPDARVQGVERAVAGMIAAAARADLVVTLREAVLVSQRLDVSPAEEAASAAAVAEAGQRHVQARAVAEALPEYKAMLAARAAYHAAVRAYEEHPACRELYLAELAAGTATRDHSLFKTTVHRKRVEHLREMAGPDAAKEL